MMQRPQRSGFTLIEVIAALAIGAILLAAVYSTLEIMLKQIRVGKEAVQSLQVIRGTAIKLQTDIRQNLSLLSTAPSLQPAPTDTSTPEASQFNFGVQGDQYTLTLYSSQTPQYSKTDADTPNSIYSDLRTITYSCQPNLGLIRTESLNILSGSGTTSTDPNQQEVLAPEVQDMHFQYFDPVAQTWQTQWDGTSQGPPAAIEVTLTVQMPDIPGVPTRPPINHRLVIAIPAFGSPVQGTTTQ